jgi:hypothetical protein
LAFACFWAIAYLVMSTIAFVSLLAASCLREFAVATSQQLREVCGTTSRIFFWSACVMIPPDCASPKIPAAFPLQ